MRYRKPLAATYHGLVAMGLIGSVALAVLSGLMFNYRSQCEPLLKAALEVFVSRRALYVYDPAYYHWYAGLAGALSVLWLAGCIAAIAKKPREDTYVDAALRSKLKPTSRGAPLDPS